MTAIPPKLRANSTCQAQGFPKSRLLRQVLGVGVGRQGGSFPLSAGEKVSDHTDLPANSQDRYSSGNPSPPLWIKSNLEISASKISTPKCTLFWFLSVMDYIKPPISLRPGNHMLSGVWASEATGWGGVCSSCLGSSPRTLLTSHLWSSGAFSFLFTKINFLFYNDFRKWTVNLEFIRISSLSSSWPWVTASSHPFPQTPEWV